jgi:hypothetical protein
VELSRSGESHRTANIEVKRLDWSQQDE